MQQLGNKGDVTTNGNKSY